MPDDRKKAILSRLTESRSPVSASVLAQELGVTRQVIVGDVALLRASGSNVIATPRGYLLDRRESTVYVVDSVHSSEREELLEELYTIIEFGCGMLNVIIEHPVYGRLTCELNIFTREEAEGFVKKLEDAGCQPLSSITKSGHLHTLKCPSEEHFKQVKEALSLKGFHRGYI